MTANALSATAGQGDGPTPALDRGITVSGIPSGWEQWDPGSRASARGHVTSYSILVGDDGSGGRSTFDLCLTYQENDTCSTTPNPIVDRRSVGSEVVLVVSVAATDSTSEPRGATREEAAAWKSAALEVNFN